MTAYSQTFTENVGCDESYTWANSQLTWNDYTFTWNDWNGLFRVSTGKNLIETVTTTESLVKAITKRQSEAITGRTSRQHPQECNLHPIHDLR